MLLALGVALKSLATVIDVPVRDEMSRVSIDPSGSITDRVASLLGKPSASSTTITLAVALLILPP